MAEAWDGRPVFVVIGAGGGIGTALSQRLLARGCRLVAASRSTDHLAHLQDFGGALSTHTVDATQSGPVEQLFQQALADHGQLDGVVNLAGSILIKPAHLTSDTEWQDAVATNLTTAFNVVRAAGKVFKQGGSVTLMTSSAARVGLPSHEAIAAVKAGVIGLTQSAAATYAPRNVRVNCVAPGLVRTPLAKPVIASEAAEKASVAMHPLNRLGEPDDVARMLEWLLDPAQSWVTGQVFGVDGGLGTVRPRLTVKE